jgi:uncharacterized protein YlzI (FlbEa/FlbD family)
MPNIINANGLTVKTRAELITYFEDGFKAIYGNDINLSSDSPDGQMINLFVQATLDNLDLIKQWYNSFYPVNAYGVVLDQRVALNGIQRQGGTFSRTNVTITTTQALTLFGLDQSLQDIYTVSDTEGNEWQLLETEIIASAGTYVLLFQSAVPGQVLTTPNTITTPVTIILGVSAINNPTVQTVIGENEESDEELKIRRERSVSLASQGYLASLLAALLNVSGVTSAFVYENNTAATDGDGVPAHSIWVILSGNYEPEDVATAIYQKRNAGCGMFGAESFTITQVDGTPFVINWDEVDEIPLFVKLTLTSINGTTPVDYEAIREQIPQLYIPNVFETVNTNRLASFVQDVDANALVTNAGFSTTLGGSYTAILAPSGKDKQFLITENNVILLPILAVPSSDTVATEEIILFQAFGGYGAYTWTINVNNSGASINSLTGEYEAGVTPATDTVRVTDADGNFTNITVTVV